MNFGFPSIRDFISHVAEVFGWFVRGTWLTSDWKAESWSPDWFMEPPTAPPPSVCRSILRSHWIFFTLLVEILYPELKPERRICKNIPLMLGATTLEASHSLVSSLQAFVAGVNQPIAHFAIEGYHGKPGYCSRVSAMGWTVRFPSETRDFSGTHAAFYCMGTGTYLKAARARSMNLVK
jgi:hypothetical protein